MSHPRGAAGARPWRRPAVVALAAAPLVALALVAVAGGEPGALAILAGRLHPLVIHFPIVLLLLAAVLELLPRRTDDPGAGVALLAAGAWAAVAAALTGLLLARQGGYDETLLFRHRWLGAGVALVAVAAAALRRSHATLRLRRSSAALLAALLVVAGHYGGALAHGAGFLTRDLPGPLGAWLGRGAAATADLDPSEARVFDELIQPTLTRRCTACHGSARRRGGLVLESGDGLRAGGDGGAVLVAGQPDASEIVRRVEAPPWDPDAMPPEGHAPLSIAETELLRAWIATGASMELTLQELASDRPPTSVATQLARLLPEGALRDGPAFVETTPADPAAVAAAREAGFEVRPLSRESPLLDVHGVALGPACDDATLEVLPPLAPQLAWLNLARTAVTDAGLDQVAALEQLRRLDLGETAVTDAAVERLAALPHLEVLNLHGTRVGDASIDALAGMASLRRLYLWESAVTPEGVERLRRARPGLTVNRGLAPGGRVDP